jgi:hypothetical protein
MGLGDFKYCLDLRKRGLNLLRDRVDRRFVRRGRVGGVLLESTVLDSEA